MKVLVDKGDWKNAYLKKYSILEQWNEQIWF